MSLLSSSFEAKFPCHYLWMKWHGVRWKILQNVSIFIFWVFNLQLKNENNEKWIIYFVTFLATIYFIKLTWLEDLVCIDVYLHDMSSFFEGFFFCMIFLWKFLCWNQYSRKNWSSWLHVQQWLTIKFLTKRPASKYSMGTNK